MSRDRLGVAVVGAGYWGPNLVRNFLASDDWDLVAVCDLDTGKARRLVQDLPFVTVTDSLAEVLAMSDVDAVAIATPAATHQGLALAALRAGMHVLVEKPLADSTARGREMVRQAEQHGLVLMADHTYCYTPAVSKIRELVADGALGEILFIDSVRINLGLVQPDVDVLWDLAPHDLSVFDFVLPGGLDPIGVSAHGSDPLGAGKACVGHLNLPLRSGAMAHVHVNWLSPTKIRQMVIGGSRRTLVWDDLNLVQRVSIYDRGVELTDRPADGEARAARNVAYRVGDTWAPALQEREALGAMVEEFAASIREERAPRTDGRAGLRILHVLEAAGASMRAQGTLVPLAGEPAAAAPVRVTT
ncbi:Gfo/Idh/MocA family oxidoreductase [Nocardioides sp. 503]|uniref:Gfo/Idh/MocA family protein n=1 Tax=Nocardioides sp. 503 TaxID=2508326 RepID=UPI00107017E4|nr:Gfo/Idh/MocA family oxidoreductase [Nocardioides sp. 503]